MDLLTVHQAKDNLSRLVDEVAEQHQPIVITGERHDAVLIAKDDWDAIVESLYLNSIPHMVDSIKAAAQEPISECTELKDLKW